MRINAVADNDITCKSTATRANMSLVMNCLTDEYQLDRLAKEAQIELGQLNSN